MARLLTGERPWREGYLAFAFWGMNVGLALMVVLSILPVGIAQANASIDVGLWYARSSDFLQLPLLQRLRWMRIIGDTLFLAGVGSFVWFLIGLKTGWSYREAKSEQPEGFVAPQPT